VDSHDVPASRRVARRAADDDGVCADGPPDVTFDHPQRDVPQMDVCTGVLVA
jgi:hypothetical protein